MKWHSCCQWHWGVEPFPFQVTSLHILEVKAYPIYESSSLCLDSRSQGKHSKTVFFFGRWPIITCYCCSVNNILYRTCQYNVAVVADAMCSKAKARTIVEASLKGDPLEMPGKRESSSRPLPFLHDIMTLRFPMRRRAVVAKNERRRESSSSCHIQSLIMHNWFACSRFQLLNLLHHHGW